MIDCFELGFDEPVPTAAKPEQPRTYAPLPIGQHEVEIIAASVGDVEWRANTNNPRGECLRLRLSGGRDYGFVFVDVPRDRQWLFKALAASLGLEPGPDGRISIGPAESLVGRLARVEIGHYRTKAGETRATVKRWLPAAPARQTRSSTQAATARTPGAKAAAAFRASAAQDEVPF